MIPAARGRAVARGGDRRAGRGGPSIRTPVNAAAEDSSTTTVYVSVGGARPAGGEGAVESRGQDRAAAPTYASATSTATSRGQGDAFPSFCTHRGRRRRVSRP